MTFGVALEVLRKQSDCWDKITECSANCEECECHVDASDLVEAVRTVLDAFGNGSELPNSSGDLIDRAEAQTELQFAARRYTVAKEAHGEGQVVWSDNLISVTDAMNALRKVPPVQDKQNSPSLMSGTSNSSTKFKPGDKFLLEIGEKRIGLDEYSIVGTDLYVLGSLLKKLTPYEADGDVEFWKRRAKDYENTVNDLVSKMTKGVKFNCMEMNAEGLTFREEKPSVQAERKKGKWIPVDEPTINGRCSVCGFESHLCEDDVYGYDYCPNCGARLEVIDDE